MSDTSVNPPTTPKLGAVSSFQKALTTPPNPSRHNENISPSNDDKSTSSSHYLPPSTPSNRRSKVDSLSNVPLTPFSNDNNNIGSPLKSPGASHNGLEDDGEDEDANKPPIRQISNTLKTRLSYAFVKYQKGWSNQSLDELEKSIDDKDDEAILPDQLLTSPPRKKTSPSKVIKPSSTVNSKSISLSNQRFLEKLGSTVPVGQTPKHTNGDSTDEEAQDSPTTDLENATSDDEGSANKAFLHAISKQTSPKKKKLQPNHPYQSPPSFSSKTPNLKLERTSLNSAYNPEADAIESLMSLASPQYSQASVRGSPVSSPKKLELNSSAALSNLTDSKRSYAFGETLNSVIAEKKSVESGKVDKGEETEDDITDDERSEQEV